MTDRGGRQVWPFKLLPWLKYLIYTPSFHSLHHSRARRLRNAQFPSLHSLRRRARPRAVMTRKIFDERCVAGLCREKRPPEPARRAPRPLRPLGAAAATRPAVR